MWFIYIDDIFSIWTNGQEKLEKFNDDFNILDPNLSFTKRPIGKCCIFRFWRQDS